MVCHKQLTVRCGLGNVLVAGSAEQLLDLRKVHVQLEQDDKHALVRLSLGLACVHIQYFSMYQWCH